MYNVEKVEQGKTHCCGESYGLLLETVSGQIVGEYCDCMCAGKHKIPCTAEDAFNVIDQETEEKNKKGVAA